MIKKTGTKAVVQPDGEDGVAHVYQEHLEELIERSKVNGMLTYEEIINFCDEHGLSEKESEDVLRILEKKNIELVTQDEIEHDDLAATEEVAEPEVAFVKNKIVTETFTDDFHGEEDIEKEDSEEDATEVRHAAGAAQITDSVKSYLRDIGKIPLLNKKTENTIAKQIADSKQYCIEAISYFPFLHKEFVTIGERLRKNSIHLKDIIQFSEFDEENLPMRLKFITAIVIS